MLANSINQLITDLPAQIGSDVTAFLSELVLCGTVVALLLGRLLGIDRKMPGHWIAMAGTLIAFGIAFGNVYANGPDAYQVGEDAQLFSGLLVNDGLTVFFRLFLLVFLVLVIALTVLSGIPDNEDGPDFYTLLIGATIGMMLMASANHLLMLFLAVEMASVPSYVMVGFLKGKRLSSEAALKYVVYGAGAAGVMLYGTSLVAGMLGTGQLHLVAEKLGELLSSSSEGGVGTAMSTAAVRTIVLGVMMILVGLAFKLSLVPFHFWCPDAFEGAPAEVGGFLSVASKAAAFALLIRVVHQLTGLEDLAVPLAIGLGVIAVVSSTFGNLAAYFQTNVKRMLAYSTIAHAGYMLTGVVAMLVALEDGNQMLATDCVEGVLFYLSVYLFMNLGAFAIVALIRNRTYSEEIADYRGLKSECPWLCVMMAVCLFSLVGLPPLGGFVAKFFVLAPVWEAASIHWSMGVLVGFALLNTVFSLFYYLKVPVAMFIADRPEDARPARTGSTEAVFVLLLTAPILLLGMSPLISKLSLAAERVAHDTITVPDADQAGARTSTSPEE
ncbi:MAG: NADH-quinone oxidoreductase subunit N [Planctomycetales bacterium]|nr:NADH-quinone oxidoreductase subunit N [Planctomycetales bacterium]